MGWYGRCSRCQHLVSTRAVMGFAIGAIVWYEVGKKAHHALEDPGALGQPFLHGIGASVLQSFPCWSSMPLERLLQAQSMGWDANRQLASWQRLPAWQLLW